MKLSMAQKEHAIEHTHDLMLRLSESVNLQDASASPHDDAHNPHRPRADRHGFCDSHKRFRSPTMNA